MFPKFISEGTFLSNFERQPGDGNDCKFINEIDLELKFTYESLESRSPTFPNPWFLICKIIQPSPPAYHVGPMRKRAHTCWNVCHTASAQVLVLAFPLFPFWVWVFDSHPDFLPLENKLTLILQSATNICFLNISILWPPLDFIPFAWFPLCGSFVLTLPYRLRKAREGEQGIGGRITGPSRQIAIRSF